uniref:Uncharacterized protein n=1 Tax=Leersia perrieri TaxID=77586 RepID=A0A0D9XME0_9ORYZ
MTKHTIILRTQTGSKFFSESCNRRDGFMVDGYGSNFIFSSRFLPSSSAVKYSVSKSWPCTSFT